MILSRLFIAPVAYLTGFSVILVKLLLVANLLSTPLVSTQAFLYQLVRKTSSFTLRPNGLRLGAAGCYASFRMQVVGVSQYGAAASYAS